MFPKREEMLLESRQGAKLMEREGGSENKTLPAITGHPSPHCRQPKPEEAVPEYAKLIAARHCEK